MSFLRTFLTLGLISAMGISQADTTLSFNDGRQPFPTSFLIKDGKILMQGKNPQGGEFASIYDSGKNHFTIVDFGNKNYYIMDKALVDKQVRLMKEIRQQMQQNMQAQLQQLPEGQRQMMQQRMDAMMNPPKPPPLKISNTGKTQSINGINCKGFDVFRGQQKVREVCVAETTAIKMAKNDYKSLRSMFAYMKDMAETMAKQTPGSIGDEGAMMADMEGIPVEMRDLRQNYVSRLEGVSNEEISPQLFAVPAGFQQIDPYAMMQQEMQKMQAQQAQQPPQSPQLKQP